MNPTGPDEYDLLLIFVRNPEMGKVKKRLALRIGPKSALFIYQLLLKHTLELTRNLPVIKEVHYSERVEREDIWDNRIFRKKEQVGEDLGERMCHAFKRGFEEGYRKIIIIGSDLLDLGQKDLEKAFSALDDFSYIIGPARDGGYYLLGMNRYTPRLFEKKPWGTENVLPETLEDLKEEDYFEMELRNDIDTFDDLRDYPALLEMIAENQKNYQ